MISQTDLDRQLKALNIKRGIWGRAELAELAQILTPNEKLSQVVNGYYENGFAVLAASDYRMLLIDKKPFNFLNVEDFRFDMINQLDYQHRLWKSSISVSAGSKTLRFNSYNQQGLRELLNSVQCRMIEIKEEKQQNATQQHDKLDRIDNTLKSFINDQLRRPKALPRSNLGVDLDLKDRETTTPPRSPTNPAFDNYLVRLAQEEAKKRYIKTGSLLPKPDLQAARISLAKLPHLISQRHRHHHTGR